MQTTTRTLFYPVLLALVAFLALAALFLVPGAGADQDASLIRGDADCSGEVNALDALFILRLDAGLEQPCDAPTSIGEPVAVAPDVEQEAVPAAEEESVPAPDEACFTPNCLCADGLTHYCFNHDTDLPYSDPCLYYDDPVANCADDFNYNSCLDNIAWGGGGPCVPPATPQP